MSKTKVYRVIDDGECILTTTDRVKALEKLLILSNKYELVSTYFWLDEEELS